MEGVEGGHVVHGELAFCAALLSRLRLIKLDGEVVEFREQDGVELLAEGVHLLAYVVADELDVVLAGVQVAHLVDEFVLLLQPARVVLLPDATEEGGLLRIDLHQADEGVAGHDVEVDVGEGLQLIGAIHGGNEREVEPNLGDFHGFGHDVDAVDVVGDDGLLDAVLHVARAAFVVGAELVLVGRQLLIMQVLDLADQGGVDLEESAERRDQKRAGALRGIEDGETGQDAAGEEQGADSLAIVGHQGVVEGFVLLAVEALVQPAQHESVDGLLAQVARDLDRRVVGPELLLVDVLLEDMAEHVRVDGAVVAAGRIIERPVVAVEEGKDRIEGGVGDLDLAVVTALVLGQLQLVMQEQRAVEVGDVAKELLGLLSSLRGGDGEALEEEHLQELGVEAILPALLALCYLVRQVGAVAEHEALGLKEVDEHEAVEQDARIPLAIGGIADPLDQIDELDVKGLEVVEEALRDLLDVEAGFKPAGDVDDGKLAFLIQFRDVHHDAGELGEEQVAVLAL